MLPTGNELRLATMCDLFSEESVGLTVSSDRTCVASTGPFLYGPGYRTESGSFMGSVSFDVMNSTYVRVSGSYRVQRVGTNASGDLYTTLRIASQLFPLGVEGARSRVLGITTYGSVPIFRGVDVCSDLVRYGDVSGRGLHGKHDDAVDE